MTGIYVQIIRIFGIYESVFGESEISRRYMRSNFIPTNRFLFDEVLIKCEINIFKKKSGKKAGNRKHKWKKYCHDKFVKIFALKKKETKTTTITTTTRVYVVYVGSIW